VPEVSLDFPRQWVEFVNPEDDEEIFRVDLTWLLSSWTCIYGSGCKGIVKNRADDGCCSHGAYYAEKADEQRVEKFSRQLTEDEWQFRKQGLKGGITETEDGKRRTRRINGACIFLNRPGFAGGAGCALHLAALAADEAPQDWKPSVCWQLPIRVDWAPRGDGTETATVRRWSRADWGAEGSTMAWCCTEEPSLPTASTPSAYVGAAQVVDSLDAELRALAGAAVIVELRRRLAP
jgi:hypothetical protein